LSVKTAKPAMSLANNPRANAADRGQTRHGAHNGRGRLFRQGSCRQFLTGLLPFSPESVQLTRT
jgi:hypothetical protein